MIGIIGAMEEEVDIVRRALNVQEETVRGAYRFLKGQYRDLQVILLQSGIGKVNAAIGTSLMIELFRPRFIINTGSAGGLVSGLDIGDVVLATEIGHHDVDTTAFGYAKGQIPRMPPTFFSDRRLLDLAHRVVEAEHSYKAVEGAIVSGDTFLDHPDEIAELLAEFPKSLAVEMESAAIAQTCYQFELPFLIIRSISDKADSDSPGDFTENLHTASLNSANTVLELLNIYNEESYG
jgi:adenosylhomocysteine nucleosidase